MIEDGETLDAASALDLARLGAGVAGLEAIVVFMRDPSHTYAHWVASGSAHSASHIASAGESLVEASLGAAATFGADRAARAGTLLELETHHFFVEAMGRFGVAFVFASSAPLGLARLAVRRLCAALSGELALVSSAGGAPSIEPAAAKSAQVVAPPELVEARTSAPTPNGERVRALLADLEASALDPHLVRMRLALRSGLGREPLASPDALPNEALRLIETIAAELESEARAHAASGGGTVEP